ncbi:MAG: VWA domain-containing protein [Propionibacteriaceae bacterium]|jgi:Ca-activated chloride channel family protein|nr:VWA domain-containing protein [Propionibacteriaceae bacterium]
MMSTLLELGFMRPHRLWGLALVPALLGIYLVWSMVKRSRVAQDRSALEVLFPKRSAWKRHIAVVAAVATLASLTLAWATPNGYVDVPVDRATVFLVVDVSLSMDASDVHPTRLKAAQEAVKEFVDDLPTGFNISLISFAATAVMLVPPTANKSDVKHGIDGLKLRQSTAIGDGIYAALDGIALIPPDPDHPNDPAPVVIVLISDGETNTGRDSAEAAEAAKTMGVPVFTIAYGTPEGYIMDGNQKNPVPVNKEELRRIAQISGGKAYTAGSSTQLKEVYSGISRSVGYIREEQEVTQRFVGYAGILGVVALLGVMSLAARWP